jgi:hypothetical protein
MRQHEVQQGVVTTEIRKIKAGYTAETAYIRSSGESDLLFAVYCNITTNENSYPV